MIVVARLVAGLATSPRLWGSHLARAGRLAERQLTLDAEVSLSANISLTTGFSNGPECCPLVRYIWASVKRGFLI